jgi:hypothetical protein
MGLMQVAQMQSMAMMNQAPVCTWDNVFNAMTQLARAMNLPPNDLWTNPQQNPAAQQGPPPDPKTQALMAQLQVKQQQAQTQAEFGQQKLQIDAAKHVSEAQLQGEKMQMEGEIALRQQNMQGWLDVQQMKLEAAKHATQLDNQAKIAKMRPGGKLDK